MKRNATLIGLAAALVVVAAVALFDRARPSTDEAAHTRGRILPAFARAQASSIDVTRRDGRAIALRHEVSGWWLAEPRRRADDNAVESLLAVLEFGQVQRHLAARDGQARQQLGLDPPQLVLRAAGHVLRLGSDTPDRGVYLLRNDDPEVLVAEHRLVEAANLDPALWRSPHLLLGDPAQASRLAFADWSVARDRGWRVTAPVVARADDTRVEALLQSLARARASGELALPPPAAGVTLTLDGVDQARLDGPCPNVAHSTLVARADGAVLCFAASDVDTLRAPVTRLYERRLMPLRLDDVRVLDVATPGRALSLRREDGAWRLIAPRSDSGPASDEKVRTVIAALIAAEARTFSSEPPRGTLVRVRLASADDDIAVELATSGGVALGRRAGETLSLEIDPALVATLSALSPASLRSPDGGAH